MSISAAEYRQLASTPKRSKYGNRKTVIDGITFDSKREGEFYCELKLREKAGEVYEVELQRRFSITLGGILICTYVCDFSFFDDKEKRFRVIDVKGVETREFKIKRRLMKAVHKVDVEIVK